MPWRPWTPPRVSTRGRGAGCAQATPGPSGPACTTCCFVQAGVGGAWQKQASPPRQSTRSLPAPRPHPLMMVRSSKSAQSCTPRHMHTQVDRRTWFCETPNDEDEARVAVVTRNGRHRQMRHAPLFRGASTHLCLGAAFPSAWPGGVNASGRAPPLLGTSLHLPAPSGNNNNSNNSIMRPRRQVGPPAPPRPAPRATHPSAHAHTHRGPVVQAAARHDTPTHACTGAGGDSCYVPRP